MIVMVVHLLVTKQVVFVMNTLFFPLFVVLLKKNVLDFVLKFFFWQVENLTRLEDFFLCCKM